MNVSASAFYGSQSVALKGIEKHRSYTVSFCVTAACVNTFYFGSSVGVVKVIFLWFY